jgi:hypothetical protein
MTTTFIVTSPGRDPLAVTAADYGLALEAVYETLADWNGVTEPQPAIPEPEGDEEPIDPVGFWMDAVRGVIRPGQDFGEWQGAV